MGHDGTTCGPTAGEVRLRIDEPQRRRALWPGLASFVAAGAAWLLTLAGIAFAPWWAKGPLAILNGLAIGVLFIVGHDACHGTLLPWRRLNRLSGRLSLLPALHPYSSWVHNHNGLHHGFTNVKEKDPGFPPLAPDEYRALPAWRRWLYRQCRTWHGLGLLYFTEMWLKWEVLPVPERAPRNRRAFRRDRLLVAAFALAWIGLLVAAAAWLGDSVVGLVLVGFVLPQVVWNWLIGFIILQQHTHPRVPWYSEQVQPAPSYFQAQVRATPHLIFPAPFRFLLRHVMEHTAHHADPAVPLYRLTEAQKSLERVYRRDIVRVMWSPAGFLGTLRVCRLYDYACHRWVDYDGTPLTEPLLPPPSVNSVPGPVPVPEVEDGAPLVGATEHEEATAATAPEVTL
jgi:omega-6 fatty acid desaturase (delta-12 desaturase)